MQQATSSRIATPMGMLWVDSDCRTCRRRWTRPDCRGAPLGAYGGIEPAGLPANVFLILGGTFDPFSAEQLEERYPNRTHKVLINRAADQLFDQGYIIEADLQEYKRTRRPLRLQPTPR
jgi:hypothetical protein